MVGNSAAIAGAATAPAATPALAFFRNERRSTLSPFYCAAKGESIIHEARGALTLRKTLCCFAEKTMLDTGAHAGPAGVCPAGLFR
jgi:hypothetical protein